MRICFVIGLMLAGLVLITLSIPIPTVAQDAAQWQPYADARGIEFDYPTTWTVSAD